MPYGNSSPDQTPASGEVTFGSPRGDIEPRFWLVRFAKLSQKSGAGKIAPTCFHQQVREVTPAWES